MSLDPWKKKVDIFRSRFVCRQDVFYSKTTEIREEKDAQTGATKLVEHPTFLYRNEPVTDEQVWKHLAGEQDLVLVMLREEGIRFGAADFDRGNVFEDAKAVRDLSLSYGIPCYIARSTTNGYHVYWFFSDFVPAHEFTSYIRHLFEELGFYQRWHVSPDFGIPEVFPKQTVYSNKGIGNGIKVPMIEPKMKEGRNCWVEDDATPISSERQWVYLDNTLLILPSDFKRVLEEKSVEILKAPASRDRQKARREEKKDEGTASAPKPFGDFWSVVEGCPAMQEYWGKDEKGNFLYSAVTADGNIPHEAYLASLLIGNATTNGVDEIKQRWPDKDTSYQLDYTNSASWAPMTCRAMQDKGVCVVNKHPRCGDHCMKKQPPAIYEQGVRIENPNKLDKDQWPEPSPIRFATDRHLDADGILERLAMIFTALKERSKDPAKANVGFLPANPEERIRGLLLKARQLGAEDFKRVRSRITANKWLSEKEMKSNEKEINRELGDQKDTTRRKSAKSFKFNQSEFFLQNGRYLRVWRDQKGNRMEEELTNFYVIIHEEIILLRVGDGIDISTVSAAEDRSFSGTIFVGEDKYSFSSINYREWTASSDTFFRTLTQLAGTKLWYNRSSYDHIRNCINAFSQDQLVVKRISRQIGHHLLKGRDVYIMPSVIVDKDSIKPNEEFGVEAFGDDFSKHLDFKAITEDEFKDLARHIVADYFTCNNAVLTMTTFAHAMSAAILPQLEKAVGFSKSPILWLGGSFSGGKTFVAEAAQNFYGPFKMIQNASGTAKSKLSNGYNFRHAFMLIDDYKKKLVDPFGNEMPQLIQATYDRGARAALQRDGTQRKKVDRVRGLLCITGEDILENESSAISRLLIVDVPFKENRVTGERVKQRRSEYCGFTPYFVQFCLNLTTSEIEAMWKGYYTEFFEQVAKTYKSISPGRVCENLTLNMVGFRLAADMMVARGAIAEAERDELCRIHKGNLVGIRQAVLDSVISATGARVFLEMLKELMQSPSQYQVFGWPMHNMVEPAHGAKQIGFWRAKTPGVIYLFPQLVHGIVSDMVKKNNSHVQNVSHVARQLFDEGHMAADLVVRGRYVAQTRSPAKTVVRVWPIKCEALGLEIPSVDDKGRVRKESGGKGAGLAVVSNQPELDLE